MAKPIDMEFREGETRLGTKNHVLDGIRIGTTWQIRLNDRARRQCGLVLPLLLQLMFLLRDAICYSTVGNIRTDLLFITLPSPRRGAKY